MSMCKLQNMNLLVRTNLTNKCLSNKDVVGKINELDAHDGEKNDGGCEQKMNSETLHARSV
jgi:hypothetical protein